jgi:hypothetical protein
LQFLLTYLAVVAALAIPLVPIYGIAYSNAKNSVMRENYSALQKSLAAIESDVFRQLAVSSSLGGSADFAALAAIDGPLPQSALGSAERIRDALRYAAGPSDSGVVFMNALLFRRGDLMVTGDRIHLGLDVLGKNYMRAPSRAFGEWMGALFGVAGSLAVLPGEIVEYRDSVMLPFSEIEAIQFVAPLPAGAAQLGEAGPALAWSDGGGAFE